MAVTGNTATKNTNEIINEREKGSTIGELQQEQQNFLKKAAVEISTLTKNKNKKKR